MPAETISLPNIRKLFVPDEGKVIFSADLIGADLYVAVWEWDDSAMKKALTSGVDMHLFAMRDIFNIDLPDDEIVKTHPKCEEHQAKYKLKRFYSKKGVHLTNYCGRARTLAASLHLTIHEAEQFQAKWFAAHPGIPKWHARVAHALQTKRCVTNKFGYRRIYLERIDSCLANAVAWIPQSTVGRVTNEGLVRIDRELPRVDLLMQVHDEIVGQFDEELLVHTDIVDAIKRCMSVTVPYADPLVIPVDIKVSRQSWGACKA